MEIKILSLELLNFKGIRKYSIAFDEQTTIVQGDNGTGKTTLFDAFTWCLFGKDSHDRKTFDIKTLDVHNNPIHKLDHEVKMVLRVDGETIELKRVHREKWQKKKGTETAEMTGHEDSFFFNEVPLNKTEYTKKIADIIDEDVFKLLTNPHYFNNMKWQDRRDIITKMAGNITDEQILDMIATLHNKDEIMQITMALNSKKTIDDFLAQIKAKKKLAKDTLDMIPTRVDEAERSKPQVVDYTQIETQIAAKRQDIINIDAQIDNRQNAQGEQLKAVQAKQQEKFGLETKLTNLQNKAKQDHAAKSVDYENELQTLTRKVGNATNMINTNAAEIQRLEDNNATLTATNAQLRTNWNTINESEVVIDHSKESCPTCQRELPADQIDNFRKTAVDNFNTNKQQQLAEIKGRGDRNNEQIENNKTRIASLRAENDTMSSENVSDNQRINGLRETINNIKTATVEVTEEETTLSQQIAEFVIPALEPVDVSDLRTQKQAITDEINALSAQTASKGQIERINQRIAELQQEETTLSQQIAGYEKVEFVINAFIKAKVETIENRVNDMFQFVSFRMFKPLITTGMEEPCCDCLVNGVPYESVNTAGQINAGIDIINALIKHYGKTAPIWIDGRESINTLLPTTAQTISLLVTTHKSLTIV